MLSLFTENLKMVYEGAVELIIGLANKVMDGGELTRATMLLLAMADKIRQRFVGETVDLCAIVSGRSGRCPENCAFCAQSAHHQTDSPVYGLLPEAELLAAARQAKAQGAVRFSIVTSGRGVEREGDFERILTALRKMREECGLEVCASLGILTPAAARALKEAGVSRYHANVETSRSHFGNICTTHTYEDKLSTIAAARSAGLQICSGGILGLGETIAQRVEMAFELKAVGVTSVPLNILNPIPGTKLADHPPLAPLEILKSFAIFRFVLPKAMIRTAGGREKNLRDLQSLALSGGLNGLLIGGYLTTGGRSEADDRQMIADLGRALPGGEQVAW